MDAQTLTSALQRVCLRKVPEAAKHDISAPAIATDAIFEARQRDLYQSRVLDANLETYYDLLAPAGITFPTEFVPLSVEDARFFVAHYEAREAARAHLVTQGVDEAQLDDVTAAYLAPGMREHIAVLEQRLAPALSTLMSRDSAACGCFVKLSSRSPKDAVVLQRRRILGLFRGAYAHALAAVGGHVEKGSPADTNARIVAMLVSGTRALMVASSSEAIQLLRLSERIYQDCLLALDQAEHGRFKLNVCVRQWVDIHPGFEWRCFCRPGDCAITCISQYCYLACFPAIAALEPDVIARHVTAYYERHVAPILRASPFAAYGFVCDIALPNIATGDYDACIAGGWVLELNPLLSSTDGALFSWQREEELIMGSKQGVAYPVVRTTRSVPSGARAMIASSWKWLLDSCVEDEQHV